jgi:hypothetical protein
MPFSTTEKTLMAKRADLNNAIAICCVSRLSQRISHPIYRYNGLMPNQAVVTIDGKQRILKVGNAEP